MEGVALVGGVLIKGPMGAASDTRGDKVNSDLAFPNAKRML